MANHVLLPDRRLIGEIVYYDITNSAIEQTPVAPIGHLTFNLDRVRLWLDGERHRSPCLFCISIEPTMVMCDKDEGDVLRVFLRTGGFYRLFGLDGVKHGGGIIEAGHNRFPRIVSILQALDDAPPTLEARKAVLDKMFLDLLDDAQPSGLLERFRFAAYLTKGTITVADAAQRLGVSVRTLERECKRKAGFSPKRILRQFRFAYLDWPDLSDGPVKFDRLGDNMPYADQAHFLNEFRDILGRNPTAMFDADEWRRRTGYSYHLRDNLAICATRLASGGKLENAQIEAEYAENVPWFPYGEETVKELGLEDWDTA